MAITSPTPVLSVVIIGRNEGARLLRCLESVRAMVPPRGGPVEIIYVDSASGDGSPERAAALGARLVRVRPEKPSAGFPRNAGWRAALAPFVLFLDGDTVLDPRFVVDSLPAFEDPLVGVVWGHRRELHPEASVYNRVLDLDWLHPPGESDFCGGDALVRAAVLEVVGGYDDTMTGGAEWEMCRRILAQGYRIMHVDRSMTEHDLAITSWLQYWRRGVRAGYSCSELAEHLRDADDPAWDRKLRQSRRRAAIVVGVPALGMAASVAAGSWAPAAVAALIMVAIVVRTSWRVGWKTSDPWTRFLYAAHSHVQQIPIVIGQLSYLWNGAAGRRRALIEHRQAVR